MYPTAHLNATFLLLGLFALARAVPSPSALRKWGMQNFCAEESAGAMELAEVTESNDGIHGPWETARGTQQNLASTVHLDKSTQGRFQMSWQGGSSHTSALRPGVP